MSIRRLCIRVGTYTNDRDAVISKNQRYAPSRRVPFGVGRYPSTDKGHYPILRTLPPPAAEGPRPAAGLGIPNWPCPEGMTLNFGLAG